ncbi:exodeoxyribonuclease VII small subunit [Helicobacter japonicus]|uniref:Exodeoxyribonuclease VII small subunit n=1 Tax=Helicobacter japonicus TaxID=425400 RepID=A0A4U8TMJ6_9HELI|nr:exodeoxyribonuclease VII small subunit [Helicobacter japonicus]TLE01236.1 exodeoxyribonuclease VII small subunit [Helicobacter japonicus]
MSNQKTQNQEQIDYSPEDISTEEQGFEEMLEKAKVVLNKLNSQEVTLKESLALYEKGMQSLKNAEEILEQAKLRYQEIKD